MLQSAYYAQNAQTGRFSTFYAMTDERTFTASRH